MALIPCPECGHSVSDTAPGCPHCGYVLTPENVAAAQSAQEETKKDNRFATFGYIVIALAVGYFVYSLSQGKAPSATRPTAAQFQEQQSTALQPDAFKVAQPVDPAFSEQLRRDLPKLLKACPGLNAYAEDFTPATVSRPMQKNFEGGVEIKFTVAQRPVKLPSPLNIYSAGHSCYFDINENGTVVSIAKNACSSICEGTARNDKSGRPLELPLDKSSSALPKTMEERQKEISKCFSSWDGSHRKLTDAVKDAMNDPKSFEHVETLYRDRGDSLFLTMTFRGKNKFGGTIKNMVQAEANMDCSLIKLSEFYSE